MIPVQTVLDAAHLLSTARSTLDPPDRLPRFPAAGDTRSLPTFPWLAAPPPKPGPGMALSTGLLEESQRTFSSLANLTEKAESRSTGLCQSDFLSFSDREGRSKGRGCFLPSKVNDPAFENRHCPDTGSCPHPKLGRGKQKAAGAPAHSRPRASFGAFVVRLIRKT